MRTRYLHQLVAFGPRLRDWRGALWDLLTLAGGLHQAEAAVHAAVARLQLCFDAVPFWQARFRALGWGRHQLGEPGRFATLPPMTRADLQAGLDPLTVHPLPPALRAEPGDLYEGLTSGSTGQPVRFRMSGAAYHSFLPVVDLVRRWYGLAAPRPGRGFVLLDVLGHSPEYGAWLPLYHGLRFEKITVGRGDWRARLRRARPQIVTGDPDSLLALLEEEVRPDVVLSSAFALPEATRDALARRLGCPVVDYYSAAETGPLALRCPVDGDWHVLSPYVHLEHDTGDEAALLVTDLRNEAFPLVRYRVGDRGHVSHAVAPCPCGLHTPRLRALDGRVGVRFRRADGEAWNPARLGPSLGRLPVADFELRERPGGAVELRYRADAALPPRLVMDLGARLRAVAGDDARLTVTHLRDPFRAPGVKPRPFIPLGEATP